MNGYLVPANAKRGTLIFNIFKPFDLILFLSGIGISLLALLILPSSNIVAVIIALLPGCVCALLVIPVPNYHNVLSALISIYSFYTKRRRYVWKGWCFYEQFSEYESKSKSKSNSKENASN